ncbi:Transposon Tf2-6 polyprotein [Araneus ventricosus]|uniref:Transposon Tf2-6 polyprotein n=1 Tax=Araneus ventricosus TaxID=182803 RepID=A0A4Y2D5A6_ARAVE|nr:Transposon Tf2-6 polyprotein [Araneus ventricosus]
MTLSLVLVILTSCFEATRGLFWDGPRNFELRSDDEDLSWHPPPDFRTTPMGRRSSSLLDQLVRDLRESRLRERLLRVPDLDIKKAVDMCRAAETSKLQAQVYFTEERSIDAIKTFKPLPEVKPRDTGQANTFRQPAKRQESSGRKYHYCGSHHVPGRCPAYGKRYRSCGKRNNFARVCKSKSDNRVYQNNAVEFTNFANSCKYPPEQFFVGTVGADSMSSSSKAILLINDRPVNFKIDTGAQANIISKKLLNDIYGSRVNVRKTSVKLSTYTGQTIELLGCTTLPVKKDFNFPVIHLDFLVTKNSYQPILGLTPSADKLGLIGKCDNVNSVNCCRSISNLLCKSNQVFEGLGNLPGKYHISLCENSVPVVSVTRKVAFPLLEPLKAEIDRMVTAGVIEKVTELTDWVSPLVIVQKKNGALRVCLDPQNLNKAIKRPRYNLPTFEDITSKLAGTKYFSVLDAVSAFWQISLDEESSRFCTFSSPFGRFKFLRMPYGIKCAPERFQRVVAEMLEDIQNAENFFDLLFGVKPWKSIMKHWKVFKRCIEFNLKLSTHVTFLGHTLSSDGIAVDKSKLEPILSMSKPEDRQSLHRYLGMKNYLSKFLPNLSTLIAPLRELIKNNTVWLWDPSYDKIFDQVKEQLTKSTVLAFFDPRIESEIVVDASPFGLGAVLQQRGKPIAFASSTLTPTQRNYAHIEIEVLAVVYGCKKFHQYVYGTKFEIYSDHKPLIAMSKKPLSAMSSRMQRFYLQLQCYDYEIFYKLGKEVFVSDTLSKAPLIKNHFPTPEEDSLVLSVLDSLPISDIKLQEISDANKSDPLVQELKSLLECGWDSSKGVSLSAKKYLQYKDELHFVDDLLLKLDLIIVPERISKDIKEMIEKCPVCAKFQIGNAPEPDIPHEFPTSPWVKVAIDFLYSNGKNYVVVVDYYSKFIEVQLISSLQATVVIPAIKSIFARHSIPLELISDGGPPFNSRDFDCFTKSWKFKHVKVSAKYPKFNGQVERTIQTVKQIFRKTLADSKDPYLALLLHRATPVLGSIYSPAELLLNGKLSTVLPSLSMHRGVQNESYYNYQKKLRDRRAMLKSYRRTLPELQPGSSVFVQNRVHQWEPAEVLRQNEIPRSYGIQAYNGEVKTRNRIHLRPNKCSDFSSFKNFTDSEEYSTSDAIPESTTTVRPQEPVDEPASDSKSSQESSSEEPISGSPDKGPYRTRYGRVVKPPSRYVAKF